MDNAAHTLSGLVLARIGGDRGGPWATALLVTSANFPDVDCVSLCFGQQAYLNLHHGITHSVLGVLVTGPILAWLFWWIAARRGSPESCGSFLKLSYLGLVVHCFLDLLLSYGMRPWLPFDGTWYYADVIYVVDPWVWVMFGAGAILGGPRRGRGVLAWAAFALATVVVAALAFAGGRTPFNAAWGLGGLWLLVLGLRLAGVGEGRRPLFARCSIAVFAGYLLVLFWAGWSNHAIGVAAVRSRLAGETIESTSTLPRPCLPLCHRICVQTREHLYFVDVNAYTGDLDHGAPLRRNLGDPDLHALAGTAAFETWQGFARHPFAGRRDGVWILGDGRYSRRVRASWCNLRVELR